MAGIRPFYSYCPYDGSPLVPLDVPAHAGLPRCPRCLFIDYRNPKPCAEVVVEHAGRALLGKRAIEPARGKWDILGGFIDTTESVEEAIHREVAEEAGLEVVATRYLGSHAGSYGQLQEPILVLCFVAVAAGGTPRPGSDIAELAWFRPEELPVEMAFPHQRHVLAAWQNQAK